MDLKNKFCTLVDKEYVINDDIDITKFPILDKIPYPDNDVFNDAIQYDKELNMLFLKKIKILNQMYPNNDRKSKQLKKTKLSLAKNNIQKIFRFKFMIDRDENIYNLNTHFKKLNIYKHDKKIDRENQINQFLNNKGNRRFITDASFDFYCRTGELPYWI